MKLNNNAELLLASEQVTVVDMGDMYSPILKSSFKSSSGSSSEQAVSRIHCIPLLMLLVFFILWAASSPEVLPDVRMTTNATELGTSELGLKMVFEDEMNSQPGGRTVLNQHDSSHHASAADSLTKGSLPETAHLRGNAKSETVRCTNYTTWTQIASAILGASTWRLLYLVSPF